MVQDLFVDVKYFVPIIDIRISSLYDKSTMGFVLVVAMDYLPYVIVIQVTYCLIPFDVYAVNNLSVWTERLSKKCRP